MQKCGTTFSEWCYPHELDTTPSELRPLVVLLPGRGSTTIQMITNSMPAIANLNAEMGAILFGIPGRDATTGGAPNAYNASLECCWNPADNPGSDDNSYIDSQITAIINAGWPIDPNRIHILGLSAGSAMAFRYACDHSSRVAAIAMFSAFGIRTDLDPLCGAGAFSIVHFHGTADADKYDNDDHSHIDPNVVEYVSVEVDRTSPTRTATTSQMIAQNGCTGTLATYDSIDFDADVPGDETDRKRVSGCPVGGEVEIWKGNASGHVPTPTAAGWAALVSFLVAHPKP